MNLISIDWEEIERLVRRTYSLGRTSEYEGKPVPRGISQADVRRMSDALAYLMMGAGTAPKPKEQLR